jgi:hypothetical protein
MSTMPSLFTANPPSFLHSGHVEPGSFAVGVKTIGRIDTLGLDARKLLQEFGLELRRSNLLTDVFHKNCVMHLLDVHISAGPPKSADLSRNEAGDATSGFSLA